MEWGAIGGGLRANYTQVAGKDDYQHVCFLLKDPDDAIVGGVIGATSRVGSILT